MNLNDKGIAPIKISGKVVKDKVDTDAYKVTSDKIEKFLNNKKKDNKIPALVNDDEVLANLKLNGIYDIEVGDLTKIPAEMKKWASYVPQNIVGTIERGRSRPKLFKKLTMKHSYFRRNK